MKLFGVLLAAAIVFPPFLLDDLQFELQRLYERPAVIALPAAPPVPAAATTELHFILPTGHADVSGWYFHDSRFPADGPQHTGLDYACAQGDPIYAAAAGVVAAARWNGDCGNEVMIHHSAGWITYYCHLSGYANRGYVQQGAVIGFCGNSGLSTGAHLHFEAHHAGLPIDPAGLP